MVCYQRKGLCFCLLRGALSQCPRNFSLALPLGSKMLPSSARSGRFFPRCSPVSKLRRKPRVGCKLKIFSLSNLLFLFINLGGAHDRPVPSAKPTYRIPVAVRTLARILIMDFSMLKSAPIPSEFHLGPTGFTLDTPPKLYQNHVEDSVP